jgi:predicted GNAT family acetyltransferase
VATICTLLVVDEVRVVDNPASRRYELWVGESLAGVIHYRSRPGALALIHTEVYPEFEGHGLGGRLVAGALDDLRDRGLQVVPICPFASSYIERHPDYADLVVGDE